jgi:threonine dehydratase
MKMISLEDIRAAARIIAPFVVKTPLVYSTALSRMHHAQIYLKLENLQKTGSFKIRGAAHKIFRNLTQIPAGGVVAASAGNHAQGVALAARQANIPACIVMPQWTSISKQEATQNYGGKVVISGHTIEESLDKARDLAKEGRAFIHPFDDADIISGQGTIALEILDDLSDADMIVSPIGGGGLISGLAVAAKSIRPDIRIIGVQTAACPSAYEAIAAGEIREVASLPSIADGINVRRIGDISFDVMGRFVDDIVLVDESHIASAILMLLERKKILAEGAGAVSLAALLSGSIAVSQNSRIVLLISGGNVDSPLLGRIISQGLMKNGRIMRLGVRLEDRPGALAQMLLLLAGLEVNVLNVFHERHQKDLPLYISRVHIELETRNAGHIGQVTTALKDAGYHIEF